MDPELFSAGLLLQPIDRLVIGGAAENARSKLLNLAVISRGCVLLVKSAAWMTLGQDAALAAEEDTSEIANTAQPRNPG